MEVEMVAKAVEALGGECTSQALYDKLAELYPEAKKSFTDELRYKAMVRLMLQNHPERFVCERTGRISRNWKLKR